MEKKIYVINTKGVELAILRYEHHTISDKEFIKLSNSHTLEEFEDLFNRGLICPYSIIRIL